MPTQHVIAMLKAAKPADAAGTLLGIPADRQEILFAEMAPPDLARILSAAQPVHRDTLVAILPPERRSVILRHLSRPQLLTLIGGLPAPVASSLLLELAPRDAAELYAELPEEAVVRLREVVGQEQPVEFWRAIYERRAAGFVAATATGVAWLDENTCDFTARVFDKIIQVGVRFRAQASFTGGDVDQSASAARWGQVGGLILLTNVELADDVQRQAEAHWRAGHPIDVMRWTDQRDEGTFKRALVRLTS